MRVAAGAIWPGVSLILVEEESQWRFAGWSSSVGTEFIPPPSRTEQERRFNSFEAGRMHFKAICPRRSAEI